jgi:uncharacterized cupin superfamily protein
MREKAIVFETGGGKLISARGSAMFFKATHASTNGAFSFMERTLPPGGRKPPPHIHTNCEEAFYVLDGEIEFFLAADTVIGRPGSFVHVPGGVSHTFGNAVATPSRLLIIHSPAMDSYFEELQELWSGQVPPSVEDERALMKRHGMEPGKTNE